MRILSAGEHEVDVLRQLAQGLQEAQQQQERDVPSSVSERPRNWSCEGRSPLGITRGMSSETGGTGVDWLGISPGRCESVAYGWPIKPTPTAHSVRA